MNQIDFFLFFWLHLHLKWTCVSFPDQRLCFVCVMMYVYSGTAEVIIVLKFYTHRFLFSLSFFFAPTCREGNVEQKRLFSYCAETDGQKFRYTADFLPPSCFIHSSGIDDISGIMFFQPLFKKWTPQKVSGVFCITTEPKCCFFFSWLYGSRKTTALCFPHCMWFALNVHDGNTVFMNIVWFFRAWTQYSFFF